jgi:hypothetical protein
MRDLISGMIMITCVASTGTPAFAAAITSAHDGSTPVHIGRARPHSDDGLHHESHHRHRLRLVPFEFYESAPVPDVTMVNPDVSSGTVAPPAPPIPTADQPPCQETGAGGVVIFRGIGCTRDKR